MAQLLDLVPQLGQLSVLGARQSRTEPAVDLGLLHPETQRLEADVELAGHPGEHRGVGLVLAPQLLDHAHCGLTTCSLMRPTA